MGELTILVCSLASVVMIAMVLVVAVFWTLDRPDTGEVAWLRDAVAPNRKP
ncbi:hypothetical protein [Methylobacterium mesophilicum]